MSRIAYVNGRYLPPARAMVHVEDRGYQFADGVYEVCEVRGRARWSTSAATWRGWSARLRELRIAAPDAARRASRGAARNGAPQPRRDGIVYLQVTRGVARRDHRLSAAGHAAEPGGHRPQHRPFAGSSGMAAQGVAVITVPDNRWARVDIKSVALLPNVLAKQAAREQGAHEAWFVDAQGRVTEGASTNAWIVTADGTLVTRPLGPESCPASPARWCSTSIEAQGLPFEERPSPSKKPMRRARPSSPRRARSCCRWSDRRPAGRQRRARA